MASQVDPYIGRIFSLVDVNEKVNAILIWLVLVVLPDQAAL